MNAEVDTDTDALKATRPHFESYARFVNLLKSMLIFSNIYYLPVEMSLLETWALINEILLPLSSSYERDDAN